MEVRKVIPEDLRKRFRSKRDLYNMLSIDLGYLLPPFHRCPMHFLRKVLSGEKELIKRAKIIELFIPRFKEYSVDKIWPMIKEVPDLMRFYPDYKDNQRPDRKYMFQILTTMRYNEVYNMLQNSRKNRALEENPSEEEFVYIKANLLKEIESVMTQRMTKGNAAFLLKRSAKLVVARKPAKSYPLSFENLKQRREEGKEEEDMN